MTNHMKLLCAAIGATLAMASGVATAESQYGYNASGSTSASITATARVTLNLTIPKLILLRVGSSDGAAAANMDTVSMTGTFSIPGTPTTPTVDINNKSVPWTGVLPTFTVADSATVAVWAWTNAGTTATLNCAATAVTPAGGPSLADFKIPAGNVTGTLMHPGTDLGTCSSVNFTSKTVVAAGTWKYSFTNNAAATWTAGTYTTVVTYTATGV